LASSSWISPRSLSLSLSSAMADHAERTAKNSRRHACDPWNFLPSHVIPCCSGRQSRTAAMPCHAHGLLLPC
jgi:hypothetical protein